MLHHLHREVEKLKRRILALSAVVEEGVHQAVRSVASRDVRSARRVIDRDVEVDHVEVEIEEECLKILALHQPVAIDLRFIIAVLKINNELERIADLAVNIADRAEALAANPGFQMTFDLPGMAQKAQTMLRKSLDSLVNMNSPLAREVIDSDDEVDSLLRAFYRYFAQQVRAQPDNIEVLLSLLTCARSLERIADAATNIAEDVIYMKDGEIVRHKTSQAAVVTDMSDAS